MIDLILSLVILGVALYLLNMLPMDATIKQIIRVLVILFVCLYLFTFFFGWHHGMGGFWYHGGP